MHPKEEAVLKLIAEDQAYENYFFRKVSNQKWFFPLKERGYFAADKNPGPQPADKEGYLIIPQWNILEYLERLSLQKEFKDSDELMGELLKIIKDVTAFADSENKHIDNYRTWWFFIKILLNIPNNKIPIEIIDLVPVWLSSKFGRSLVDADIATKLLPKFLYENASREDIKKAEKLVEYLTDILWIKAKGVFTKEEEKPEGVVEDHWLIEAFIDKGISKLIGKLCGIEIVYKIAERLKTISKRQSKTTWIDIKEDDEVYRFNAYLEKDDHYVCTIGVYQKKIQDEEKELLESFSVKPKEIFNFRIEATDAKSFSKAVQASIVNYKLPEIVRKEIINKAEGLHEYLFEDYSHIWFKDLSSISTGRLHEVKHILLAILVEILLEKAVNDKPTTSKIIETLLSKSFPYPVFKRIILVLVAKNWNSYKDIFWNFFVLNKEKPLLENPSFEYDVRHLLIENVRNFTNEEKEKIDKLIEKGPQKYLPEENKDKYVFYWKKRWYSVLKDDPYLLSKYKKIDALYNLDVTEEEDSGGTWIGPGSSPINEEEILKLDNKQIALYIKTFKEDDRWKKNALTSEGLASILENSVKNNPIKFVENLDPFRDTGFYYVYHLIDGLKGAWSNKKSFDWSKVLIFVEKYINRVQFWNNELKVSSGWYHADNKWVIGAVGELIEEGTRNDEWSIPTENFASLKRIFSLIGNNVGKDEKDANDFPTHLINCGLGKTLIGLIYFILRVARLEKKNKEPRWNADLKEIFEIFLNKNIYDAYTVLGEYLISFAYLDKKWAQQQIVKLKTVEDKVLWEAFMSGYLTASRLNLDLHILMKDHYEKGLSYDFKKEKILNERLIHHIAIAYLNGTEKLDGSGLLGILWKKWNDIQIVDLIGYFWTLSPTKTRSDSPSLHAKMRIRIIDFWRKVYEKYKDKKNLTKEDRQILSEIIKLIVFLPKIDDENFEWIMLSAPYAQAHYNSPYLLEQLNELKNKGDKKFTAYKIAKIYLEILKHFKPDYDREDIRSVIEYLYSVKDAKITKLVNQICNEYARSGIEIVTDIYEKFN